MKFSSLQLPQSPRKPWQYLLPGLLACVIWAQLLGISHRYTHPFFTLSNYSEQKSTLSTETAPPSLLSFLWDSSNQTDDAHLHSCLLFDAASAADQIYTLISLLIPANAVQHQQVHAFRRIWDAQAELAFHSRAPPASN